MFTSLSGFPYVYVHCRPCSGQRVKWRIKCTFYQRLDSPRAATFPIPASFFVCSPPIYQASGILSTGSREFSALGIIISGRALGTQTRSLFRCNNRIHASPERGEIIFCDASIKGLVNLLPKLPLGITLQLLLLISVRNKSKTAFRRIALFLFCNSSKRLNGITSSDYVRWPKENTAENARGYFLMNGKHAAQTQIDQA
jgi:hypothetical protein